MRYRPLPSFLYRAPLLPTRALPRAGETLRAHPLGLRALTDASPSLARALATGAESQTEDARRALSRYARRAAYRPTPHGLWAGVGVGVLGEGTFIDTGHPTAGGGTEGDAPTLTWSEARVAARAQLDDQAVREQVRLRVAPSLLTGASRYLWLALGDAREPDQTTDERVVAREPWLDVLVDTCRDWAPWPAVRTRLVRSSRAARRALGEENPDAVLLSLIDDELLHCDLFPPLVGPPAGDWLAARLADLGRPVPAAGRPATLLFASDHSHRERRAREDAHVMLDATTVARAAALVPLLTRLQHAMAGPPSERHDLGGLATAAATLTDLHGEGRFPLGPLGAGDFGVTAHEEAAQPAASSASVRFASWLGAAVGATMVHARHAGPRHEIPVLALDGETLQALLPACEPPLTAELFLSPASAFDGASASPSGWLLGLHAPAASSWGRFLHDLPPAAQSALAPALEALVSAEASASAGEETLDVAYAASPRLGELGHHPPLRRRCLALTSWPAEPQEAVTPAALGLVCEEGDPAEVSTRVALTHEARPLAAPGESREPTTLRPSPLHRVRAHTAPPGVFRLLAGWTLQRQHAPWAMPLGPLADLPAVPRMTLDGFVIAPAAWRLPEDEPGPSFDVRAWRRAEQVPRWVQVGEGDELLPVDLQAPEAWRELRGHRHVYELWPSPSALPDRRGRRVEAVVAVVQEPDVTTLARRARQHARRATREDVMLPGDEAASHWTTYKLFGAREHQDELLGTVLVPFVRRFQRATHAVAPAWFFQRYVEGPGERHHVRLRLHAAEQGPWSSALTQALAASRRAGTVTSLECTPYIPERGRFGAAQLPAVHSFFEAQSEAALAVLTTETPFIGDERALMLVRLFEAFAIGCGLDASAREACAERARAVARAHEDSEARDGEAGEAQRARDKLFRRERARLRSWLGVSPSTRPAPRDDAHARAVRRLVRDSKKASASLSPGARDELLPILLHLFAVRVAGPDRPLELTAYTLWQRTLEGLRRAPLTLP